MARRAARVGAVLLEALAQRRRLRAVARLTPRDWSRRPGGGDGTGAPSRFSRIHLPRFTGDVRLPTEVTVRKLP